ncbi:MAG: hypothetical protein GX455_02745 [Phycisphaerae bacterium]|nr:hypothetical protein [Phycisphaerae bacterium]
MKTVERVLTAGGVAGMLIAIGNQLYWFVYWILQQPDLYRWTVQLY